MPSLTIDIFFFSCKIFVQVSVTERDGVFVKWLIFEIHCENIRRPVGVKLPLYQCYFDLFECCIFKCPNLRQNPKSNVAVLFHKSK